MTSWSLFILFCIMEVSGFFEQDVVDLTHDDEPDASLSSTLEAVASYKRTNGNTRKTDIIEDPTDKRKQNMWW